MKKLESTEDIENELYRILNTYEKKDLINSVMALLSEEESKQWINDFHEEDSQ